MTPGATKRPRKPRTPLTRDRVLGAAMELADGHGLESLTMRRLAGSLGVEAMALYYHVANKEALVAAMLESVVEGFPLPGDAADPADWRAEVRRSLLGAYAALERHPWAGGLLMGGAGVGPARLAWMEALLGTLRRAGFSAWRTHLAYHAIDSHLIGFTLWQAGYRSGSTDLAAQATQVRAMLPPELYPALIEHIDQHLEPHPEGADDPFAFGLDLVLDGLERVRSHDG